MILTVALDNFNKNFKQLNSGSIDDLALEIPCEIRVDKDENICLTDLWKSSGGDVDKRPNDWLSLDNTKAFIDGVSSILNTAQNGIIKSKRGKGGGTYAHKQVALAYAKYLSPQLHVLVNNIFFERLEEKQNPETAIDRAIKDWKKQGKDEEWISTRLRSKAQRSEFTATLSQHKVANNGKQDNGFSRCTNAIYDPLLGGSAKAIKQKKNLPKTASIRDSLGSTELAAVMLAEALSAERIKSKMVFGNEGCENECKAASTNVAMAVIKSRESHPIMIG